MLLDKADEATECVTLAEAVRKAFNDAFYNPATGQYGTGSQTANAMPLYLSLITPKNNDRVQTSLLNHLKEKI